MRSRVKGEGQRMRLERVGEKCDSTLCSITMTPRRAADILTAPVVLHLPR